LTSSGPGRNDTQHTVSRNIYFLIKMYFKLRG
jgi:hypothetical protein